MPQNSNPQHCQQSCEGESIVFESNVLSNDQIVWTGPNGWTSSSSQPKLTDVRPDQAGNYTVYITRNGCKSEVIDFDLNVCSQTSYTSDLQQRPRL